MAGPARLRIFTVAEARRTLPRVKVIVAKLLEARARVSELEPHVAPVLAKVPRNGGNAKFTELTELIELLDRIAGEFRTLGVLIKDVDSGLVDFPALRQGERVYLCWRHGEEELLYWHPIDTGFAGRRPIIEQEFDDAPRNPFMDV